MKNEPILDYKLKQLKNFLTDPNSGESKNYINDLLSGSTRRPEEQFVQKFLNVDFWKELGFADHEIKIEGPAGVSGRVEITLQIENQKIAVECKKPYLQKGRKIVKNFLDGEDIKELEDQIGNYLLSHSFIIFTNGFHWYFYSRESYKSWLGSRTKKDSDLKPYFDYLKSEILFDENSQNYILNILKRENILNTLSGIEYESIRHILTKDFFLDLKSWISIIDDLLKNAPINLKVRTTVLINKLIFVRTMEDVGILPNRFLEKIWNSKKGSKNSVVNFIDQIDDELSEIYNTELFTSKYILNENGKPLLKNGVPEFTMERRKNFAYSALPDAFFSGILRPIEPSNLKDTGFNRVLVDKKEYDIRSLYWWRFESIPGDILGKAYETYLARERKKLGIYYTSHQITEYITQKAICSIFDHYIIELRTELSKEIWDTDKIKDISERIKEIRICDPSCGSGSFLIQAVRVVWNKYNELRNSIKLLRNQHLNENRKIDEYFKDKFVIILYLENMFRIYDKFERIGTLILRHIFGNDKDIKAIDTAKLNIWLECIRLDPNAYRKENVKDKHHVLPSLEMNLTNGDSLIGLENEEVKKILSDYKDVIKTICLLKENYNENYYQTNLHDVLAIQKGLIDIINNKFIEKYGDLSKELLKITKIIHWPLLHIYCFFNQSGELKESINSGFDIIIGNPPWEILKPNIDEFFGPLYNSEDVKRFSLLSRDEKNVIKNNLLTDNNILSSWNQYQKNISTYQNYFHETTDFKYQSSIIKGIKKGSDINFYKLFLEKYFSILKKDGYCGIVLPSGFYSDLGSKGLREFIFSNTEIQELISFINRKGIFEEIHRQFKFIILLIRNNNRTKVFKTAFYEEQISILGRFNKKLTDYDLDLIKITSPHSLSLIECKSIDEIKLMKKLFKFPLLDHDNKWIIKFRNEFHMTKHSYLFNKQKNNNGYPLYEGKTIHQFNNSFSYLKISIDPEKARKELLSRETKKLKINKKENSNTNQNFTVKLDYEFYRLVWRDITNATNERTLIATIVPHNVFLGNTLNYLQPINFNGKSFNYTIPLKGILFLCGLFNSFVVDFILRRRVATHANMFYIIELPIPRYQQGDPYFSEVYKRVGSLICITDEYKLLRKECNISNYKTDQIDRNNIIAEINAYTAKIYDLTRDEFKYILNTFPLVKSEFKDLVLSKYDLI